MIECSISNLTKYYGANKIFENISFDVKSGERIGLIGQNGCGKTTVMKMIMGIEDYHEGSIAIRKDARVGYLNQISTYNDDVTTMDVIYLAFQDVFEIKKEMKALENQFSYLEESALEKALNHYSRITQRFEALGGYEIETKINKIMEGLKIDDSLKGLFFNQLSGGEKTRIILAKILLEEPDILLLDEPSNHLDLESIEWLEAFLKEYKGSVLVISHDRYFLDCAVNKIVELEFDRVGIYHGNYSYYVIEKERRFLIEYRNYQNQQKKIDQMERQIERYRIWGAMRDSDKMFRRAKELEKRLEKIDVLNRPVFEKRRVRLDASIESRTGKIVLEAEDLSKGFSDRLLLKDVHLNLHYQDSACIIGKNGSGKTTLLKMLIGELDPDKGSIKIGSRVKIGYLPQHVVYEDEELTVLEYFTGLHNLSQGEARSQLAKALFIKEDVNKKIKSLSGGEKSRLKLSSLAFQHVNFMILDEPTNHLDIASREVLEETLSRFEGTLLFVSHDRYFMNKVSDKIIEIEDNSTKIYCGDYTYYLEEKKKKKINFTAEQAKETKKRTFKNPKSTPNPRIYSRNNVDAIEQEIMQKEGAIKEIDNEMERFGTDPIRLSELFDAKKKLQEELDTAYEVWENF